MEELKNGIRIIIEEADNRFLTLEVILLITIFSLLIIVSVLIAKRIQENLI